MSYSQARSPFSLPSFLPTHRTLLLSSPIPAFSSKQAVPLSDSLPPLALCAHHFPMENASSPFFTICNFEWQSMHYFWKVGISFCFYESFTQRCRGSEFLEPFVAPPSKKMVLYQERDTVLCWGRRGQPTCAVGFARLHERRWHGKTALTILSLLVALAWPPPLGWSLLKQRSVVFSYCALECPHTRKMSHFGLTLRHLSKKQF